MSYGDAIASAQRVRIREADVPFLGLESLIASKETYREQDGIDRLRLMELKRRAEER